MGMYMYGNYTLIYTNIYIYIYNYIYMEREMDIHIYIYIEREREREIERSTYMEGAVLIRPAKV